MRNNLIKQTDRAKLKIVAQRGRPGTALHCVVVKVSGEKVVTIPFEVWQMSGLTVVE